MSSGARQQPPSGRPPDRRHLSWRQALVVGLTCFVLWTVLDAPSLLRSAEASPVGARRTAAIEVLRPIAALSRGLGLSWVVHVADDALGRRPGDSVVNVAGPPRRRATPATALQAPAPATAPPVTAPDGLPPLPAPTTANPLRVLVVGDSIGIDLGDALVNDLARTGVVDAVLDGHIDTGLTRPDYFDWQSELGDDLARDVPQVVVVLLGANDPQDFVVGGHDIPYGSPAWLAEYGQRVAQFMQRATATGARVLWIGLPPMADPGRNAAMQQLNAIYQAQAAGHPGVTFFPSWPVLSDPQGGFAAYLPDASGSEVQVRTGDGTHLTPAGADRLAVAVIGAMDRAWGLSLQQ